MENVFFYFWNNSIYGRETKIRKEDLFQMDISFPAFVEFPPVASPAKFENYAMEIIYGRNYLYIIC